MGSCSARSTFEAGQNLIKMSDASESTRRLTWSGWLCRQQIQQQITRPFTLRGLRPLAARAVKGVDWEGRGHACADLRSALGTS